MMLHKALFVVAVIATECSAAAVSNAPSDGPVVDLGYTLHKAKVNETGKYYSFNNIHYSEPLGQKHRFQRAEEPTTVSRTVNDGGSMSLQCPQAYPEWSLENAAAMSNTTAEELRDIRGYAPNSVEDCLLLDVVVPQSVYEKTHVKSNCNGGTNGAPVLVWIHGGGYVFGQKATDFYNPSGLIASSQLDGSDGIVYVALNYRMGLFGFLNEVDGVFPNVGLQDQLLALQWIKKNIHLFGGNPDLVTVMGESAGGGSIIYHLTAEGGTKKAPFQRAISQSGAFTLDVDNKDVWNRVLSATHSITGKTITTAAELAQLDYETLNRINVETVFRSPESLYTFGPSVDGGYIAKPPAVLLHEGKFDHSVDIMAGHNANETAYFVPPKLDTEEKFVPLIRRLLPHLKDSDLDYMLTDVYPPPGETDLYSNEHARGALLVAEMVFVCNTRYLGLAQGNNTYNYRFQVPPAAHADDVPYTFWHGKTEAVEHRELAVQMQRYFTKFVKGGNPNDKGGETPLPEWPVYGEKALINTFGPETVDGAVIDDAKSDRCAYWQKSEYLGY